ncbi:MAG: phytase, partial [Phycisphaerae bacterium]|nr:phytase [Phycisphaerae bacterium]
FWKHPKDPAKSIVVTSDKFGNRLCAYDLEGKVLQVIKTPFPGNIDSRAGFTLGGKKIDIIVHNQRTKPRYKLRVYTIDPATRKLTCIDNGAITTGPNYGGALYHSRKTGKFYFFTTSKQGPVQQIELFDDGKGKVGGKDVRHLRGGYAEGAVADDAAGTLFVAEERRGIWAFGAEPEDKTQGKLIVKVGQNGLRADVEGVTILPVGDKGGYLIASSQGNHTFKVYRRAAPYDFVGTFNVAGSIETDGIDVIGGNFGKAFPGGIFACHSGRNRARCPVLLASWKDIAAALGI